MLLLQLLFFVIAFLSPARFQAMKAESPLKKLAVPAAMLPFLAPVAAFAAEGTGRVSSFFQLCGAVI